MYAPFQATGTVPTDTPGASQTPGETPTGGQPTNTPTGATGTPTGGVTGISDTGRGGPAEASSDAWWLLTVLAGAGAALTAAGALVRRRSR